MRDYATACRFHRGFSLIELMIAVAISSFLMLGLTATFRNSSNSQRALEKSSQMIENGRYATSLLNEDIRHAGYYGHYYDVGSAPAALPDPCEVSSLPNLETAMAVPIQAYIAPNLTTRPTITSTPATTCHTALLTGPNLSPGSDILIIRRADTAIFTGVPNTNEIYLQANSREMNLLRGSNTATVPTNAADGVSTNLKKYPSKPSTTDIADTRKYRVHVYFVSPCSFGSGANDVCTAGDERMPTLKRLELDTSGGNTAMRIVPLVEGVEYFKVEFGIDNNPTDVNAVTGMQGDGMPDLYTSTPSGAQFPMVVSVRTHLLTRATTPTASFSDGKQYVLGGTTVSATGDAFKRHVFTTEIRPTNLGGRREIPQ